MATGVEAESKKGFLEAVSFELRVLKDEYDFVKIKEGHSEQREWQR